MSDTNQPSRQSLGDISHLFLTGLRQQQQAGAGKPPRRTPPRPQVSIDITPEEMSGHASDEARPHVTAVLAHHLSTAALQRVRDYARHAASVSGRIGLIELGDDGLRLTCFDASPLGKLESTQSADPTAGVEPVNGKRISEALEELSWDVRRWMVYLPGGTKSEIARKLLGKIDHWTLLATADDDGIVAAYRALKSAADIGEPTLSMAVFGAEDEAHGTLAHRKLSNAAKQFLNRQMDCEGRVAAAPNATEHVVLWCRAAGTGGPEKPTQEHWTSVIELAEKSVQVAKSPAEKAPEPVQVEEQESVPEPVAEKVEIAEPIPMKIAPAETTSDREELQEVVDLADGDALGILNAVMKRQTQWVQCAVEVPMHDSARVAVDREGNLVLAAAAGERLSELPKVSRAYAWLIENRSLVRLAFPQMKIEAGALPKLALIVDQAEAAGDKLSAILQGGNVTVHTYRRLRWGEKTGLLLEAA